MFRSQSGGRQSALRARTRPLREKAGYHLRIQGVKGFDWDTVRHKRGEASELAERENVKLGPKEKGKLISGSNKKKRDEQVLEEGSERQCQIRKRGGGIAGTGSV